ncbi:DoxX family protein [Jiulongibacter sediminis]|uniref:DoxX-like family protein n=1 Tax=Jiulongibacter sediminis TaxID=1605367 RepID=A0A0P7C5N8_9BACT|nr:DoxX family protein [Jiulongibacter sediminis]KPM49639.1 DoxX-like family protein [Jiulongibacter sediminis]TBX26677.1 DoxX-like family protein [Jiulongibacter sediminis]
MNTNSKASKIIYWVATGWLSLGMLSTGIVQLIQMEEEVKNFDNLGYPHYLMSIIGVWKILGVIAILMPGLGRLKEWAYAGFFFTMSGAAVSHVLVKDPAISLFGPFLLLILTMLSWYFRPDNRKL